MRRAACLFFLAGLIAAPGGAAQARQSGWEPAAPAQAGDASGFVDPCYQAEPPPFCIPAEATPGPVPPFDPFSAWNGRSAGERIGGRSIFQALGLQAGELSAVERGPRLQDFGVVSQIRVQGDTDETGKAWAFEGRACAGCRSLYLIYETTSSWRMEVVTTDPSKVGPGEEQFCIWPNRFYNFSWQCWVRPRTVLAAAPDAGAWQRMHQTILDLIMDAEPHPWSPYR
ncbi:MAG: hypothetical protein K1X35_06645 [Caulobacteraceae bacterium]|nr:hypothetical protein [Caulobacteraceae bacterium]